MVLGEPVEKTLSCIVKGGTSRNQGNHIMFNDKISTRLISHSTGRVDKKFEYCRKVRVWILGIEATIMQLKQ